MNLEELENTQSFHCIALRAYLEIAEETQTLPPDCELTRRRAYKLYEERKRNDT
jgi:hypothetical protein